MAALKCCRVSRSQSNVTWEARLPIVVLGCRIASSIPCRGMDLCPRFSDFHHPVLVETARRATRNKTAANFLSLELITVVIPFVLK